MRHVAIPSALVISIVFAIACSSPPGRGEPEAAPVASNSDESGDESVANDVPVDVACEVVSTDPGIGCAGDAKARGRLGAMCPDGTPMAPVDGAYAFPEAPVDASAMPDGVHVTASGLGTCVVRAGTGTTHPRSSDHVEVHYLGWNAADGTFDSSVQRGTSISFPLDGVIAGWTEGVQLMTEGEVRRFFIPEYLAYQGRPGRPGGMLLFDVELLAIGGGG